MRNLIILTALIFLCSLSTPLIIEILQLSKAKESAEKVVRIYLNHYKKSKKGVPDNVWQKIEKGVNYNPFLNNVAMLYENNYSQEELKLMLSYLQNGEKLKYEALVKRIENPLYIIGNEFGTNLQVSINKLLKMEGY